MYQLFYIPYCLNSLEILMARKLQNIPALGPKFEKEKKQPCVILKCNRMGWPLGHSSLLFFKFQTLKND